MLIPEMELTPDEKKRLIFPMTPELLMEATMCLWEFIDGHPEAEPYRKISGVVQLRHDVMNFVAPLHAGWCVHEMAGDNPITPFDWEFTPWFVDTCILWSEEAPVLRDNWLDLCRQANKPEDTEANHTFVFETQQFFEIEAPAGTDPDDILSNPETLQHFADLILSGFIDFAPERTYDETRNEI